MAKKKTADLSSPVHGLARPPVVVILGHVDHGKTTLLDAIRSTDVAGIEYGGITQKIGAYQIEINNQAITFIDTPGHQAFSNMRSRGASVADIAILVVAANDSVMPQTVESIKIIQEAKIPYIVAINKIDLPEANFDKVVQDLLRHNVLLETYGGDVPFIKISAKKKEGIKELLDLILLLCEVSGLNSDPDGPIEATVIESSLDKNRGPLATVIVRNGTIKSGQEIFFGEQKSKIRALIDYQGKNIPLATPGTPVEIFGLSVVPPVGTKISSLPMEKILAADRTLDQNSDDEGKLNLILKADSLGSLEAIFPLLPGNVVLLKSEAGDIFGADILLAKSTKAIILGFNVKLANSAKKLAETEKVLIRTYKIIYELLDELKDAAAGMLTPVEIEEELGRGEIIAEFPFEKLRIAGTKVKSGRVARGDLVKVMRREEVIGKSKIKSVRTGKEETNKIESGKDCGIFMEPQIDFRIGDDIISYRLT